jgi:hypothetical protein
MLVIHLVRKAMRRVRPGWVRPEVLVASPLHGSMGKSAKPAQAAKSERVISAVAAAGITLVIGYLLLWVVMFSTDRGQILFALAAAFFVGSAIAQYLFPNPSVVPACAAVLTLAIVAYLKACLVHGAEPVWILVWPPAHALPIDWLTAGCGGAVGGHWLASRLHDLKHMPKPETTEEE